MLWVVPCGEETEAETNTSDLGRCGILVAGNPGRCGVPRDSIDPNFPIEDRIGQFGQGSTRIDGRSKTGAGTPQPTEEEGQREERACKPARCLA